MAPDHDLTTWLADGEPLRQARVMGALRVLMVDDDPDLRGLLRRAPAEEGLAVVKPFHIAEIVGRLRALLRRVTVADLPDGGARFRLELPAA